MFSSSEEESSKIIRSIYQDVTDFAGTVHNEADIAIAVLEYTPQNAVSES